MKYSISFNFCFHTEKYKHVHVNRKVLFSHTPMQMHNVYSYFWIPYYFIYIINLQNYIHAYSYICIKKILTNHSWTALGNSGEDKPPLTEEISSKTRLRVCGHLPRLVGVTITSRAKTGQVGRANNCTSETYWSEVGIFCKKLIRKKKN